MNKSTAFDMVTSQLDAVGRSLSDSDLHWLIDELRDVLDQMESTVIDSDEDDEFGEEE